MRWRIESNVQLRDQEDVWDDEGMGHVEDSVDDFDPAEDRSLQ